MSTSAPILQFPVELTDINCVVCGVKFALPKALHSHLSETHKKFFCPNGHDLHFLAKSTTDHVKELEEALAKKEAALKRISRIETGVFNKASLELAIEIATNALDKEPAP